MSTLSTARSFRSPRSVQNARTRIYIPGSDPFFRTTPRLGADRITGPYSSSTATASPQPRLFSPSLLDRLQSPITRYFE